MSVAQMTTWEYPLPLLSPTRPESWGVAYWLIILVMWWLMMIAMMVPSAIPMILLYGRVFRHNAKVGPDTPARVPSAAFLIGYLMAWLSFSVGATVVQWWLEHIGVLHGVMMWVVDEVWSGSVLIVAGLYQLSPIKHVCLKHCRSPAFFLAEHWRNRASGALRMGFEHGLFCVGCCWFLMALLFVGGVMNLVWIAGLTLMVAMEKLVPHGDWVGRCCGLIMILAGSQLVFSA